MSERKEACSKCAFWVQIPSYPPSGESVGECHRYAPRIGQLGDWPVMLGRDFCGDFLYPTLGDKLASELTEP